jgi:pimeloyl-ACP methyl ester carboxylesterase
MGPSAGGVRVESLLSARLFLSPRVAGGRLYFVSDLSGRLSLYAMDARPGGSVPEPLLPPSIALQNPELIEGLAFHVFPRLGVILVMLDQDGDENYQPMRIPLAGGFPEPAFGDRFAGERVRFRRADVESGIVYFVTDSVTEAMGRAYRAHLASGEVELLAESMWGADPLAASADHTRVALADLYTFGDSALYEHRSGEEGRTLLLGKPLEARREDEVVPPNGIRSAEYTAGNRGLFLVTSLHDDAYGLGYLDLDPARRRAAPEDPAAVAPVAISGLVHEGAGELMGFEHMAEDRYLLTYNIDGCSWIYRGRFDESRRTFTAEEVICGRGELAGGVVQASAYDEAGETVAVSFSTATTPTQIFTMNGARGGAPAVHTRERLLGLPAASLTAGEDASFISFDGLRISARLYLPSPSLGYGGPRPLVYYVHGGPQGQERPDFAWFSMPLIQFLALRGFAVFVPNARGSTGYGLRYMKHVDRDWGGKDRLDHLHALTEVLARDPRLDTSRAGVIGRSYGGYMTLTLASRHPERWSAAVDMFGPYDLCTFIQRIPESWKPYFAIAVGDLKRDRDFLVERSPATYMDAVTCPLLVIQGRNDPRVIEQESRDVVEGLRARGKAVEYLVFEDEGHDVLKHANKVRCYNAITEFFAEHLRP